MLRNAGMRALAGMRPAANRCAAHPMGIQRSAMLGMRFVSGGNPKVFFEVDIGGKPAGRITFELFNDVTPKVRE